MNEENAGRVSEAEITVTDDFQRGVQFCLGVVDKVETAAREKGWEDEATGAIDVREAILSALSCIEPLRPATEQAGGEAVGKAALDILAERRRQVEVEGWTPEHDDEHAHGELAEAAAGYAEKASGRNGNSQYPPRNWPWDLKWWKPSSPRRMLVKAAALIIAEIERIDRNEASK